MIIKKCTVCGKEIRIKKSHAKKGWGKFCSKNVSLKLKRRGNGSNATIAKRRSGGPRKISGDRKAENFSVPWAVIVHGRMKTGDAARMPPTGRRGVPFIGDF